MADLDETGLWSNNWIFESAEVTVSEDEKVMVLILRE